MSPHQALWAAGAADLKSALCCVCTGAECPVAQALNGPVAQALNALWRCHPGLDARLAVNASAHVRLCAGAHGRLTAPLLCVAQALNALWHMRSPGPTPHEALRVGCAG